MKGERRRSHITKKVSFRTQKYQAMNKLEQNMCDQSNNIINCSVNFIVEVFCKLSSVLSFEDVRVRSAHSKVNVSFIGLCNCVPCIQGMSN